MKTLTQRQQDILFAIHRHRSNTGLNPTVRELADLTKIRGLATLQTELDNLVDLGYLAKDGKARNLNFAHHINIRGMRIPVIGEVA